jgi:glycosyltransferase involved in cell wall biosynthesis
MDIRNNPDSGRRMNLKSDSMSQPTYSVVIPVFNSSLSLEELWDGIKAVFEEAGGSFEVVFVDDGSVDRSWDILAAIKERDPQRVTAVRLSRNFGQHNATLCGLGFAKGELVITMDDDLQAPPGEIPVLIRKYRDTHADIVYGIYGSKKHSALRNFGSTSLKKSTRLFKRARADGSSFRLLTAELVKKILHHRQNFIFLDEVLHWYTDVIAFAEVRHLPRKYKQSGYTFRMLLNMLANLLLCYTTVPLKVLVYGGFALSLLTMGFGIYFIINKIFFNVPLGYTSLIVAILFSTSIILFSLGIIGEYLRRIYQVQNQQPPYSIRKVI